MQELSLGYLSLPGASAIELVQAAGAAQLTSVGIRIAGRQPQDEGDWVISSSTRLASLKGALQDNDVTAMNVAAYYVNDKTSAADFASVFDTAAALGARFVCVSSYDADEHRLSQTLAQLAEAAAPYGLSLALEFVPYSATKALEAAIRVIAAAENSRIGILLDILHFMRSNSSMTSLRSLSPHQLAFVQICDGCLQAPPPNRLSEEARGGRLYPGEGAFPLSEILAALPTGLPLEIEVPHALFRDRPYAEQASRAATVVRDFLGRLTPDAAARPGRTQLVASA